MTVATRIVPAPGRQTLAVKEIAAVLDWHPKTVIRQIKAKRLRVLPGRPFRAYPEDVLEFIMSGGRAR